jgi:hypothetical protein
MKSIREVRNMVAQQVSPLGSNRTKACMDPVAEYVKVCMFPMTSVASSIICIRPRGRRAFGSMPVGFHPISCTVFRHQKISHLAQYRSAHFQVGV